MPINIFTNTRTRREAAGLWVCMCECVYWLFFLFFFSSCSIRSYTTTHTHTHIHPSSSDSIEEGIGLLWVLVKRLLSNIHIYTFTLTPVWSCRLGGLFQIGLLSLGGVSILWFWVLWGLWIALAGQLFWIRGFLLTLCLCRVRLGWFLRFRQVVLFWLRRRLL